jgi:hypothetical protein
MHLDYLLLERSKQETENHVENLVMPHFSQLETGATILW